MNPKRWTLSEQEKAQLSSKWRLCGDRGEITNYIIREFSKLAQIVIKLGVEGDPLGSVQKVKILPYEQMVYTQSGICPGKWEAQNVLEYWYTNGSHKLGQTTRPCESRQKQRNLPNCEKEKRVKCVDISREEKKNWIWM